MILAIKAGDHETGVFLGAGIIWLGFLKPETVCKYRVVGTSRCDVRTACSGATSNGKVVRIFLPPATMRAETAQRAIPITILHPYETVSENWIVSFCFTSGLVN